MGLFNIFKKNSLTDVDNKYVFDKAKYHGDSVIKAGLDEAQSFVHTGLFVAWLVENDLMSDFFTTTAKAEIEIFKKREISPSAIYMNWDGVLIGEMLSKEGYNFALDYFDFKKGKYVQDYKRTFGVADEDFFEVQDTWRNYEDLGHVIHLAYEKWRKKIIPSDGG